VAGTAWTAVAVGAHTCALDASGSAWCWGLDDAGQVGQPPSQQVVASPTLVEGPAMWQAIAAGARHSCALAVNGQPFCWGDDSYGQSGANNDGIPTPVALQATQVVAGGDETCVGSGTAFSCFGANDHGQLGNQTTSGGGSMPTALPGSWLQLSVGQDHACGVAMDHTLSCWGANGFGELGVGSFVELHEPQPVGSMSDWASVAAGVDNTCALTLGGDLYCWGRNLEGEVGDGAAWRSMMMSVP
jgi:hypothetical protein